MKKSFIVSTVILLVLSSFSPIHKFYVSVTQINYAEEQKSLQIISRLFIDDMEKVLKERYDAEIRLGSEEDTEKVDKLLQKYLRQKLKIEVNDEEKPLVFIGKEYENDLLLCYLEISDISSLQTITVTNSILMDVFEEQQNIVHVKKGKERKSLILQKELEQSLLKFSE